MLTYQAFMAVHILAVIIFAGGMVFLPRLMLAGAPAATVQSLLRLWINPALVAIWVFGFLLLKQNPALMKMGWMHSKISLALLFTLYHGYVAYCRKRGLTPKHFGLLRHLPFVLTVAIVALVMMKPF